MTPLWERLRLRFPIFQAPTGSIAGPELCAAVTNAGGMGALGLTWTSPKTAASAIVEVKQRTDNGPFQANFALHFAPEPLNTVLDAGVPIVTFSWGDAAPYIGRCHAAGAIVGVQVTNAAGAKQAIDSGVDFLICQGVEAGGHVQSTTPLIDLLPRVVALAGNVPVVAAGGIGDAADVQKVLSLGASGAMCGTRFVACRESRAHDIYKAALVNANAADTALTVCFDGGWPYAAQRVLRNRTFQNWEAHGSPAAPNRPGEGDIVGFAASGEAIVRYEDTAPRTGMTGDIAAMCLYAGTSVAKISDLPTAAEIITRLVNDVSV